MLLLFDYFTLFFSSQDLFVSLQDNLESTER